MRSDSALEIFLGRWLTARIREEAVSKTALALHGALSSLTRGETPAIFKAAMASRISHLEAMIGRIDGDGNNPPTPLGSPRGQWLKNARRLLAGWNESDWAMSALELSGEKNPLMLAAVSQSLDEAIGAGQGAAREAAEHVRKLRTLDEREFRSIPVAPGPQAPWDPSAYVFPSESRSIFEGLEAGLAELVAKEPADSPRLASAKALSVQLGLIEGGWPIPVSRLEAALRPFADLLPPEGAGLAVAVRKALRLLCPDAGVPASTTTIVPGNVGDATQPVDLIRQRAEERLNELARVLLSESSDEARAFGRRLKELGVLPGSATAQGLHQELVGCLAFLDEPGASGRWRRSALEQIAGISQELGGGELLNEQLLDRPLGDWTEFVTVVGNDDQAPPGEPGRITRVERDRLSGHLLKWRGAGPGARPGTDRPLKNRDGSYRMAVALARPCDETVRGCPERPIRAPNGAAS